MRTPRPRNLCTTLVVAGVLAAVPMLGGCGSDSATETDDNAAASTGGTAAGTPPETEPPEATWVVYTLPG